MQIHLKINYIPKSDSISWPISCTIVGHCERNTHTHIYKIDTTNTARFHKTPRTHAYNSCIVSENSAE